MLNIFNFSLEKGLNRVWKEVGILGFLAALPVYIGGSGWGIMISE